MSAITGTNLTKNNKKFNLDRIQGIDQPQLLEKSQLTLMEEWRG